MKMMPPIRFRVLWLLATCLSTAPLHADPVEPGPPLLPPDSAWIEATLAEMTLDEKIGQMIMPAYSASNAASLVADYHVGGFIFISNNNRASDALAATNYLQTIASTPLLFSVDCEAGLGARFLDATRFPMNMGSAAAYDLALVSQQGRVTARECRALGIHIGFGPVLDVNTKTINPIIGTRAYSDNPSSVTALARAYVQGANAEGLLCTYKHFPGHGASAGDSHNELPTINITTEELHTTHLNPYTQLLSENTVDLVMTAHVWYPVLDPGSTPWPATLSTNALTNILRNQLGYQGCIISDAFNMQGLTRAAPTYDAVKHGVLAGLDIILIPSHVPSAFNGLRDRVISNEIPESRIDAAVRRILALKSRVGLPEAKIQPVESLATVGHPDNKAIADQIGHKTIAADLSGNVIPVAPSESLGVFVLGNNGGIFYSYPSTWFTDAMTAAHPGAEIISVSASISSNERSALLTQARSLDKVLIVSLEWKPRIAWSAQSSLVEAMASEDIPLAYISFGSPYQWDQFPDVDDFLCGFSYHYATQQKMAEIITGTATPSTNWPVSLVEAPSAVQDWALYQ